MALRPRKSAGLLLSAVITLMALLPEVLAQKSYPDRPIRIIVPSEPGGGSDTVARLIAQGMSERLLRQMVVENRPGAGTIIGSEIVAKAPPDGYTLLLGISPLAINPAMHKKMPYDVLRDFAPITQAVSLPNLMVLHPSVPARSVKELIALAKARPNEILFGSAGYGTLPHLSVELFAGMAQIRMIHVTYKSTGPGVIDLIGGRIALMAPNMIAAIYHVRAGRLRALGVTTAGRVAAAPEIPTIAEAGLPGYESVQWYGLLAPAGTPREIIARLHQESAATLGAPKSKEILAGDGCEAVMSSPQEFAAYIKAETVKWAKVVKDAGIRPE
jgi:tripartite-type tricarboxylate transporter receptor subunit TctC